jgi:hypothetical protein
MSRARIASRTETLEITPPISSRPAFSSRHTLNQPTTGIGIDRRQLHAEQVGRLPCTEELELAITGMLGLGEIVTRVGLGMSVGGIGLGCAHWVLGINKCNID